MAAIEYLESTPVTTAFTHTGDTNWTDVTGATLSGFTGSDKYLLVVSAVRGSSSLNIPVGIRVLHASTTFATSEDIQEPSAGDSAMLPSYLWFDVFTQPATPETIKVQVKTASSSGTVTADEVRIYAINLSDLTENTDWFFSEDTSGPTDHTTAMVDRASLTFTPGEAGDDWLILGRAEIIVDTASVLSDVGLVEDGSNARRVISRESEDTTENSTYVVPYVAAGLSAASHTYKIQTRDQIGPYNDYDTSAVFALNLAVFESHTYVQTAGLYNPTTTDWEELGSTGSYAPTTTGDHMVIGDALGDPGGLNRYHTLRLQFDATSDPAGWETTPHYAAWDAAEQHNMPVATIRSLSSAGVTIDLDGKVSNASANWYDRTIVAFSMELAAAGALTISPALQDQSMSTFAPSFGIDAKPGLVDQTLAVFAPQLDLTVSPALQDQSLTTFAPTLSTGPVQIDPALVDQTVAAFAPTFAIAVTPGAASQVLAAFGPAFSRTIDPALVSQLVSPSDPAFTVSVTPGLASQLAAASDPQLDLGVAPALQSQLLTPFDPALHRTVTPALESQLLTAYDPALSVNVTPALQSQLLAAFDPLLDLTLPFTLVTQTLTPYDPSVSLGAQILSPALQSQLASSFAPQLDLVLPPGLVSQLVAPSDPTFTVTVIPGLVDQSAQPFNPALAISVIPTLVTQALTSYDPTLTTGPITVSPGLVSRLIVVTDPRVAALGTMTPVHKTVGRVRIRSPFSAQFYRSVGSLVLIEITDHLTYVLPEATAASSVFQLDYGDWENVQVALAGTWLLYGTTDEIADQIDTQLQSYGFRAPDGSDLA